MLDVCSDMNRQLEAHPGEAEEEKTHAPPDTRSQEWQKERKRSARRNQHPQNGSELENVGKVLEDQRKFPQISPKRDRPSQHRQPWDQVSDEQSENIVIPIRSRQCRRRRLLPVCRTLPARLALFLDDLTTFGARLHCDSAPSIEVL